MYVSISYPSVNVGVDSGHSIAVHFKIPRFNPEATSILYEGDARPFVGYVEFNDISYLCRVGRVSYSRDVPIWDSRTDQVADFTTRFSFNIDTHGKTLSDYAAGLAFFLAPVGFEIPPNSAGGFLGLFNTTTSDSSRNQIVLVEFDTYSNSEWDPPVQHIGINTNSIASAKYTTWNFSLYDGKTADAWISYNATAQILSVTFNYKNTSISKRDFTLSHHVDLKEILPERVKVGISAATSHKSERHRLLSWEFSSSLEIKTTDEGKKRKRNKMIVVLVVLLSILMIVVTISFVFFRRWKKMKEEREERVNLTSINDDLERGAGPRRFSYNDLVVATNNFSNQRKLGEGGFGAVFKGYFNDSDTAVAVKKIARGSRQGRKEYITEIKIISRLRHRNLVQLLGLLDSYCCVLGTVVEVITPAEIFCDAVFQPVWKCQIGWYLEKIWPINPSCPTPATVTGSGCYNGVEFLLVYDFMPNGSLDPTSSLPLEMPVPTYQYHQRIATRTSSTIETLVTDSNLRIEP
ncbi:hypothetical protein PVK06_039712 [Gossypium arboreum]|uniref:Protein kinase domain-containing protein n=1 Tax=Gossypium arboreum TaxID=29729 RepID=A0ABR0N5P6_GOSAR|nr:hypothetical protein PVK06_039712 [Gossypium arboreum]